MAQAVVQEALLLSPLKVSGRLEYYTEVRNKSLQENHNGSPQDFGTRPYPHQEDYHFPFAKQLPFATGTLETLRHKVLSSPPTHKVAISSSTPLDGTRAGHEGVLTLCKQISPHSVPLTTLFPLFAPTSLSLCPCGEFLAN